MATLSACLVVNNEERNIATCLQSVSWADEIIVIDSGSTDRTVEICRQYTDNVHISPWKGCGPQKKQVYELATKEWVLIIDADEYLTPELQQEIKAILQNARHAAYEIPFQSYYCNKAIKYGDWINEKHLRLMRREQGKIVPRLVHFGVEVNGSIGKLKHKIIHNSFPTLEAVIDKVNRYSTDGALHKISQGKKSSIWQALSHGIFAFIRGYILRLGFLDGREGFMLAVSNAEGAYYRYLKVMYLKGKSL